MRYAIAVDVGIRNLGLCVFDFCTATFVFWDNITLVPNGRYIASNNVKYVRDFVARFNHFFSEAAVVLVERQMRCNMRIIESVLHTMFFDRCIIINARSVKAHYKLSTRNYRLNKQKAVEWAEQFTSANPSAFSIGVASTFVAQHKKDDLADSLLLLTYYLDTYSNQLGGEDDIFTPPDDVLV